MLLYQLCCHTKWSWKFVLIFSLFPFQKWLDENELEVLQVRVTPKVELRDNVENMTYFDNDSDSDSEVVRDDLPSSIKNILWDDRARRRKERRKHKEFIKLRKDCSVDIPNYLCLLGAKLAKLKNYIWVDTWRVYIVGFSHGSLGQCIDQYLSQLWSK